MEAFLHNAKEPQIIDWGLLTQYPSVDWEPSFKILYHFVVGLETIHTARCRRAGSSSGVSFPSEVAWQLSLCVDTRYTQLVPCYTHYSHCYFGILACDMSLHDAGDDTNANVYVDADASIYSDTDIDIDILASVLVYDHWYR